MNNPFSQETKELFRECYKCFLCDELPVDHHHIMKREADSAGSAFNCAALCRKCHDNITFDDATVVNLLTQTIKYLFSINYVPKAKDYIFLEEYKELVEQARENIKRAC